MFKEIDGCEELEDDWETREKLLIAKQAIKIDDLEESVKKLNDVIDKVRMIIYCIGGPLNDNKLKYTREQMGDFGKIISALNV